MIYGLLGGLDGAAAATPVAGPWGDVETPQICLLSPQNIRKNKKALNELLKNFSKTKKALSMA